MLISFRAKRVNKKNVSRGKQSWGLGGESVPAGAIAHLQLAKMGCLLLTKKIKR